jgi:hypothetical protein
MLGFGHGIRAGGSSRTRDEILDAADSIAFWDTRTDEPPLW